MQIEDNFYKIVKVHIYTDLLPLCMKPEVIVPCKKRIMKWQNIYGKL